MQITINNEKLTATINYVGAELVSLKNKDNKEYIWEGNPQYWGRHSPVLFPIVGILKENKYKYNGKTYSLSGHGFARDMEFELIQKTQKSASFILKSTQKTKENYPFDFELLIGYILTDSSLEISYTVINKTSGQMLFSIGGHPGFALKEEFKNYALEFDEQEILEYNFIENGLISEDISFLTLSEKQLPLNYDLFKKGALVFKKINSKGITILENSKPLLKIIYNKFPNLGIWTPPQAPFLCIEPWFGYADTTDFQGDISKKEGIQILENHQKFYSNFSIEIF